MIDTLYVTFNFPSNKTGRRSARTSVRMSSLLRMALPTTSRRLGPLGLGRLGGRGRVQPYTFRYGHVSTARLGHCTSLWASPADIHIS